jgi:hypothetical protein
MVPRMTFDLSGPRPHGNAYSAISRFGARIASGDWLSAKSSAIKDSTEDERSPCSALSWHSPSLAASAHERETAGPA